MLLLETHYRHSREGGNLGLRMALSSYRLAAVLDSRLRGNDEKTLFLSVSRYFLQLQLNKHMRKQLLN